MSNLANLRKPSLGGSVTQYLRRVARDVDYKRLNPPRELNREWADVPDEWLGVGYIPCPQTRLGWFMYHVVHGLAMRYPLRSVLAFALLHSNPNRGKEAKADD